MISYVKASENIRSHQISIELQPHKVRKHLTEGKIPVLMYHQIRCGKSSLEVCPESLYAQLSFMRDHGFTPVSLDEYLQGNYNRLIEGEKPYLVTFDDGSLSQFSFSHGAPDPNSAVGVLERFRKERLIIVPAIFFAITDRPIFGEKISEAEKLNYLISQGYVIANHTNNHASLSKATAQETVAAFGLADRTLDYLLGSVHARVGAFPFGALPNKQVRNEAKERLSYVALFHAFGGLAKNPLSLDFDGTAINRYETHSTDDKPGGLAWLLTRYTFAKVTRE